MRPLCARLRLSRIFEMMMALLIVVNVSYVIYYRMFVFEEKKESHDKAEDKVNRNPQPADVRVLDTENVSTQVTDGPADVSDAINTQKGANATQRCPDESPFLVGDLACDCGQISLDNLVASYQHVEPGGRLVPDDCKPARRTAIIIPFRDRKGHLSTLLNMLLPILQRQQADVTFFVIEQSKGSYFNRAALLNIGYLEALKIASFDCIIFHDVDLMPLNDHNVYKCGPNVKHFVARIKVSTGATIQTHENYTGGVISFTRSQYQAINGHSNLYFGWGGEDEDLHQRIVNKHMKLERPASDVAIYQMLSHEQDNKLNNPQRFEILKSATQRQDVEGLNTCKYSVNYITKDPLFTWINVSLNVTEVLMTAPDKVLQDINAYLKSRDATSLINNTSALSSVRSSSSSSSSLPSPPAS